MRLKDLQITQTMNKLPLSLVGVAALLLGSASSQAATFVVTYDFEDSNTIRQQGNITGAGAGNMTADNATFGSGLTGGFSGSTDSTFAVASELTLAESSAVSGNDYFEFTVNAASGYQFDLDSISLNIGATDNTTDSLATYNAFVRSNAEAVDYTNTLGSENSPASTGLTPVYNPLSISLTSNTDFDNLTSVTFRVYNFKNEATAQDISRWARMDDVVISGDVSLIPEPSAAMLLLGGLGALITIRRRR
jgi:hypothetical protein